MKFTLVIIIILVIISLMGAYAYAHIKRNKDSTEKLISIFQSILFYGVVAALLVAIFYYFLN